MTTNTDSPTLLPPDDQPVYAFAEPNLVPVSDHLGRMTPVAPSRMFVLKDSVNAFRQRYPDQPTYDASQGDGGASLPGTPRELLERAAQMQIKQGTAYIPPAGANSFRRAVIEKYWRLDPSLGFGPQNVLALSGGRDGLDKAYEAMQALGYGRQGDALIVTRMPWLCYTWAPYILNMNVIWAPGSADEAWSFSEDSIRESVAYAQRSGRKAAGIIITSPDNPTGKTLTPQQQAALAHAALEAGVAFVLFDWMYHYVTDEQPMDLNAFLQMFDPADRQRLMFLDGITKSLGGSNIRNAHLIAAKEVIDFNAARMSHMATPTYYSMAVAEAAYEMGFAEASRSIVEPTNASRRLLRDFLDEHNFRYIMGKGYYTFIHVCPWMERRGWTHSEQLASYLGAEFGLAVVPGEFFSPYGREWIRFSYASPPELVLGAAQRLVEGLHAL